jgi:hypothetical protein
VTDDVAAGPGTNSGPVREQMVSKDKNKIDASGQTSAKDSTSGPLAGPPDRIPGAG